MYTTTQSIWPAPISAISWASAGRFHNAKSQLKRFMNTLGGFTDQAQTYSNAAGTAILPFILGSESYIREVSSWDGLIQDSELIVSFGGIPLKNLQVASGGAGEHRGESFLRQARESGVQFVNVGPIRDDLSEFLGAEWIAPRPGTDTALMLGIAHTLAEEGLLVLGVEGSDGTFLGAPTAAVKVSVGDELVVFGPTPRILELETRVEGEAGDRAHIEAIAERRG